MNEPTTYTQDDPDEIAQLLLGRRIVQADKGWFDYRGGSWGIEHPEGRLVLDDGTVVYLAGNGGCGGCPSGHYELERVATVDNIITNVRTEARPASYDDAIEVDGTYRIFVFAGLDALTAAEFVGTDGNGYYGTGFWMTVIRPEATT